MILHNTGLLFDTGHAWNRQPSAWHMEETSWWRSIHSSSFRWISGLPFDAKIKEWMIGEKYRQEPQKKNIPFWLIWWDRQIKLEQAFYDLMRHWNVKDQSLFAFFPSWPDKEDWHFCQHLKARLLTGLHRKLRKQNFKNGVGK